MMMMSFFNACDIVGSPSTCAQGRTYCERKRSIVMLGSWVGALRPQTSSAMRLFGRVARQAVFHHTCMEGRLLKPRGTVFPSRSSLASRLCDCCCGGVGRAICFGTRGFNFIRGLREIGFCPGVVLRKTRRPGLIGRFCDCRRGGCEYGFCQGRASPTSTSFATVLGNGLGQLRAGFSPRSAALARSAPPGRPPRCAPLPPPASRGKTTALPTCVHACIRKRVRPPHRLWLRANKVLKSLEP